MESMTEFLKAAPAGFAFQERCTFGHDYKYFATGKGCLLGSMNGPAAWDGADAKALVTAAATQ